MRSAWILRLIQKADHERICPPNWRRHWAALHREAGFGAALLASEALLCRGGLILRSPPVALLLEQALRGTARFASKSRGSRAGETESGKCGADKAAEVKELSFIYCM